MIKVKPVYLPRPFVTDFKAISLPTGWSDVPVEEYFKFEKAVQAFVDKWGDWVYMRPDASYDFVTYGPGEKFPGSLGLTLIPKWRRDDGTADTAILTWTMQLDRGGKTGTRAKFLHDIYAAHIPLNMAVKMIKASFINTGVLFTAVVAVELYTQRDPLRPPRFDRVLAREVILKQDRRYTGYFIKEIKDFVDIKELEGFSPIPYNHCLNNCSRGRWVDIFKDVLDVSEVDEVKTRSMWRYVVDPPDPKED